MKAVTAVVASLAGLAVSGPARAASPIPLAVLGKVATAPGYRTVYWAGPNTICHNTPGGRFCHPAYRRVWVPGHHNWRGFWIPGHWA